MDAATLKEYILSENKIEDILHALGLQNVKKGRNFYTCANIDGDNATAINVSIDTLNVLNHTRPDFPERADIITLVEYIKDIYFTHAIHWLCEQVGLEYYAGGYKEQDIDPCLLFLEQVEPKDYNLEDIQLCKISDMVLDEYVQVPNKKFFDEGISIEVQNLFEVGISVKDNCITIPIRDELGNLIGVKGRTLLDYKQLKISKFWYPYQAPKNQILYGLDKTYKYIKERGEVYVFEAEKSVMKSWSYGFQNCVAVGGHELSSAQVTKLERLNVNIVLALDKDVEDEELTKQINKFILRDKLFVIYEKQSELLDEKDSPVDKGREVFLQLCETEKHKVKK